MGLQIFNLFSGEWRRDIGALGGIVEVRRCGYHKKSTLPIRV